MFLFFHGSSDVIYQKGVQNVYHSNDVDDFIGAKIKTPKNPWTKNLPPPPRQKKKKKFRTELRGRSLRAPPRIFS